MDSKSDAGREDYGHRIRQRLGLCVSEYEILNIHKIGIDAPASYIFEELLDWDVVLRCWPGHIATLENTKARPPLGSRFKRNLPNLREIC